MACGTRCDWPRKVWQGCTDNRDYSLTMPGTSFRKYYQEEVRCHGLLANSVAYDVTGQCYPSSVYSIKGHGNPSTFLLHGVGGRFQNVVHCDEHYTSYAHYQSRVGQGEFPEGNREKERGERVMEGCWGLWGETQHYQELRRFDNHSRYRTRSRSIGEEIKVYHRRLVRGQQFILRWWLQKTRMDHCLEPTETHFTAPPHIPSESPHVTTVPPPPMTSTSGFRSGGWTTLDVPPSASTPNRPLTSNVDRPIPP